MGTSPVLVNVTCWSPSDLHQPCLRTGSGRVMEELSAASGRALEGHTALHLHPQEGLSLTPRLCSLTMGTLSAGIQIQLLLTSGHQIQP